MKLRKDIWQDSEFGDIVQNINVHDKDPLSNGVSRFISLDHIDSGNFKLTRWGDLNSESTTFSKVFESGDTLFGKRRSYLKKVALADFGGLCSGDILVFRSKNGFPSGLVPFITASDRFIKYAVSTSAGSLSPRTKWKDLAKFQLKLPPKDEQEKILSLFLTLEKQIEQTELQEGNLRKLRTKISTELVSPEPKFGSLINGNCRKVNLGDLAKESRATAKNPLEEGIERFVGLEHIEPGNLKIQGSGNVADGTTFTKVFEEGDVLFGRRRAYLKKAAKADFKGLCSGDITVLKANPKNILPELLPYYMSADPVFEFAVSNSAGSLSPRAKWRDLSKMELSIPDLKSQREILEVFHLLDKNVIDLSNQKETLKKLKHKLLDEILG